VGSETTYCSIYKRFRINCGWLCRSTSEKKNQQ
jgi:hypothetical protein